METEKELKQEKNNNKNGALIATIIISTIILSAVVFFSIEALSESINYQTELEYKDITLSYKSAIDMIGFGDDGISNTPISATIQDGILTVVGRIKNKTGKKLTIKDFAVINYGGYDFAGNLKFTDGETLENNSEKEITYEVNISNLKHINVLPTTVYVELGTYDQNDNYLEFDIKYINSWNIYD